VGLALATALVLAGAALYNNYPLLYPDTGTYGHSGLKLFVPGDRPMLYGLFIRISSLWLSLWMVIAAQALLTGWAMRLTVRAFVPTTRPALTTFVLSVGLLALTGAPIHVGQLIPDIFTPISLLLLGLLLWAPSAALNRVEWGGVALLYIFSLSVHNSHLALHLALLLTALPGWWHRGHQRTEIRRLGVAGGLLLLGILTIPTVHRIYSGRFELSRGTHVFMMNRLVETGVLEAYLDEVCPNYNWSLCAYRGQIPSDFIWDMEHSPLYKSGGWDVTAREYNQLIFDLLSRPRYLSMFIGKCLLAGAKQAFTFPSGGVDTPAQGPGSPGFSVTQEHFRTEVREAESARQQIGRLDYHDLNERQLLLVCTALAVLVFAMFGPMAVAPPTAGFVRLIFAGLWWNAMVCGALSTVVPRYQSRVIWLLPLAAVFVIWPWVQHRWTTVVRSEN
jgi:hypothetical protein